MTEFVRTPDENFANLTDFQFTPHYHVWQDLRMHYIDEGSKDAPVMLLLHGMPTWSYLYRDFIEPLVSAGYRCEATEAYRQSGYKHENYSDTRKGVPDFAG